MSKKIRNHFHCVALGDYCYLSIKSEDLYYIQHLVSDEEARLIYRLERCQTLPDCSYLRELKLRLESLQRIEEIIFKDNLDMNK